MGANSVCHASKAVCGAETERGCYDARTVNIGAEAGLAGKTCLEGSENRVNAEPTSSIFIGRFYDSLRNFN